MEYYSLHSYSQYRLRTFRWAFCLNSNTNPGGFVKVVLSGVPGIKNSLGQDLLNLPFSLRFGKIYSVTAFACFVFTLCENVQPV